MNRNAKLMKKEKDDSELIKLACQVLRLQALQGKTDKQSIINELSAAQIIACDEIKEEERKDGDIYSMPWNQFSDVDLQRKLRQYERALRKKGMKDIGKRAFEELVKKKWKNRKNNFYHPMVYPPKKYHVTQWSTSPQYDIPTMSRVILQQNIGYRKVGFRCKADKYQSMQCGES